MSNRRASRKQSNPNELASPAKKRKANDESAIVDDKENADPQWKMSGWSDQEILELVTAALDAQWFSSGHVKGHGDKIEDIRQKTSTNRKEKAIRDKLSSLQPFNWWLLITLLNDTND